jgi:hypothetical protein
VIGPYNDLAYNAENPIPECMSLKILNITGNPGIYPSCPKAKRFLSSTIVICVNNRPIDELFTPSLSID